MGSCWGCELARSSGGGRWLLGALVCLIMFFEGGAKKGRERAVNGLTCCAVSHRQILGDGFSTGNLVSKVLNGAWDILVPGGGLFSTMLDPGGVPPKLLFLLAFSVVTGWPCVPRFVTTWFFSIALSPPEYLSTHDVLTEEECLWDFHCSDHLHRTSGRSCCLVCVSCCFAHYLHEKGSSSRMQVCEVWSPYDYHIGDMGVDFQLEKLDSAQVGTLLNSLPSKSLLVVRDSAVSGLFGLFLRAGAVFFLICAPTHGQLCTRLRAIPGRGSTSGALIFGGPVCESLASPS